MVCGAELKERTPYEERKVVSVLFCDLVGFTASSHAADPEDVQRQLGRYHAAVKGEIERCGGVVEKFIGDAVVGVWGVPQAHEDDAERAVRAALSIIDVVELDVRIAVNTGEVLATIEGSSGEVGVVGDVVNTASRLQASAEVGSVLVGQTTMRMTAARVEYVECQPVVVKGKPEPVTVWRAVRVSPPGSQPVYRRSPFVGRVAELDLLRSIYARSRNEGSVQLVTVAGEPG